MITTNVTSDLMAITFYMKLAKLLHKILWNLWFLVNFKVFSF